MSFEECIRSIGEDAERLEAAYVSAVRAGEGEAFAEALRSAHRAAPDSLLYSAWYYRLAHPTRAATERAVNWLGAVPLAALCGLALWLLSDDRFVIELANGTKVPMVVLLAAVVSALFVVGFLLAAGGSDRRASGPISAAVGLGLAAAAGYALVVHARIVPSPFEEQYLILAAIHLAFLSWTAVGSYLLWRHRDAENRFAFLTKSLEVFMTGGLFGIACGAFAAISFGLFDAVGVDVPQTVMRLFLFGGGGLVPVLAVAVVYDPRFEPARQAFEEGLSRFVGTLMRVLLPLTLAVLAAYMVLIARNFRVPFENRDVLIIYNAMLFAVMAMLVGATPVAEREPDGATRLWLRRGIVVTALLALVVGVYALAAIVYRTANDVLTPNRVAFIGWNVVNACILLGLLAKQARARRSPPVLAWSAADDHSPTPVAGDDSASGAAQAAGGEFAAVRETFAMAMIPYAAWSLLCVLGLPLIFGRTPPGLADLPPAVQEIVAGTPGPILLKCATEPEIYLLEGGRKRWIRDIPTLEAQGFNWSQVHPVTCADIDAVPDGPSIPEDATRSSP